MKTIIKIGGRKTNLEDIPPALRNKIEEQLKKENTITSVPIEKDDKSTNNKKRSIPGKESIFRKMFGFSLVKRKKIKTKN